MQFVSAVSTSSGEMRACAMALVLLSAGDEGDVGEDEDGGSMFEEPGAQSGTEVGHAGGVVGEWARREAVRAEDASKASSWS
jgi:hypothetical protein